MKKYKFGGKIGEGYDLLVLAIPYFKEFENSVGKTIKNRLSGSARKIINVLEIGCGTGKTTEIILKSCPKIKIVAVDNEPVMLKQAKSNLKNYIRKGRVKLINKDALDFLKGLPDNSYDIFASALTLHNFNKAYRRKLLAEVYRTLRKGGFFVNADRYASDNKNKFKKALEWQIRQYKEKFSKIDRHDLIEEWIAHEKLDKKPSVIMKEKVSINQMKAIGFKNMKIIYRKTNHAILVAEKTN